MNVAPSLPRRVVSQRAFGFAAPNVPAENVEVVGRRSRAGCLSVRRLLVFRHRLLLLDLAVAD
jgi:hypothetical protein